MASMLRLKTYGDTVHFGDYAPPGGVSNRGDIMKKRKTEQKRIERKNAQYTHSIKTLIDEEELARFLKGGLAAK
jgi:hypothetical protein